MKAVHQQKEKVKLNDLVEQVQEERKSLRSGIRENQLRVSQYKKNRHVYIKSETKDMEK